MNNKISKTLGILTLVIAISSNSHAASGSDHNQSSSSPEYLYDHQMITALFTSNRSIGWRGGDDMKGVHLSAKASANFLGFEEELGEYSDHFYLFGAAERFSDNSANQEPTHTGLRGGIGGFYPVWHADDNSLETDVYVDLGLMYHNDDTRLRDDSGIGLYYGFGFTLAVSTFPDLQLAWGLETYPGQLYSTSYLRVDYDVESFVNLPALATLRAGTQNFDLGVSYRF